MKENQKLAQYVLAHQEFPGEEADSFYKMVALVLFSIVALLAFFGYFWVIVTSNIGEINWILSGFVVIVGIYGLLTLFSFKDEYFSFKKLSEIETVHDAHENFAQSILVLKNHFKLGDIRADKKNLVIRAVTQPSLWTYGDAITIVCDNKRILINCKATRSQFFSYGQQKRHYHTFKESIQGALPIKA